MWFKQVNIKVGKVKLDVLIFLDVDKDGCDIIKVRSMSSECFLEYEFYAGDRDISYSFIENFPLKTVEEIVKLKLEENDLSY